MLITRNWEASGESEQTEVLVIEPLKMWVKYIVRRKWALKESRCTVSGKCLPGRAFPYPLPPCPVKGAIARLSNELLNGYALYIFQV